MKFLTAIFVFTFWSCCHGALLDIITDCCQRGTTFANLGRDCHDLERTPDVDIADQESCMTIMMSCCASRLPQVLCERAVEHRMSVGSCDTMSNDSCYSSGEECCKCCDLGITAYHSGIPCNSMMTGTPCETSFQQCCQTAELRFDENECDTYQTNLRLCSERCVNLIGSYVCECNEGSRLLEDNITCLAATTQETTRPPPPRYLNCDQAPCQYFCRQLGREYECYCPEGYELMSDGYSCNDIDECEQVVCEYGERCQNTIGSFRCFRDAICRTGLRFESDLGYCVDIDECTEQTHDCDEQSICENSYSSYNCIPARCPQGYYVDRQSNTCRDVDECSRGIHNCQDGFRCDNLEGSFTCTRIIPCGTGYTINGVTQQCEDVDECSQNHHNCGPKERCINTRGSYGCEPCPTGLQVDRNNRCLEDVDECQEGSVRCGDGTSCQNTFGSYQCVSVCRQGFEYNRQLRACMDIDECLRGTARCGIYEICQNTNGSFSCGCRRGYRLNRYRQCTDINECEEGLSECLPNQRCHNLQGQYQCRNVCRTGFRYNRYREYCEDINECVEGSHRCQDNQRCINQEGGYVCQCPPGHQANRNAGTCDDIDECRLGLCRGTCENLPGSYICTCPAGYSLMENKVTCKDADECTNGNHTCRANQYCFNTRGGFQCETIDCPRNFELQESTNGEIVCRKQCPNNDIDCIQNRTHTVSHTFVALPTISMIRNPIRILTIGLPNYQPRSQTDFNIRYGNEANYFSITNMFPRSQPTGNLSLNRAIIGPYETILHVEIVTMSPHRITGALQVQSSMLLIHIDVGPYRY